MGLEPDHSSLPVFLLLNAVFILIAVLVHQLYERPVMAWVKRRSQA